MIPVRDSVVKIQKGCCKTKCFATAFEFFAGSSDLSDLSDYPRTTLLAKKTAAAKLILFAAAVGAG